MEYKKLPNGALKPTRIYNILISTQHTPETTAETITNELTEKVIKKVCPAELL